MNNLKDKLTDINTKNNPPRLELTEYVIAFAKAASQAQKYLSTNNEAVRIKEAEFTVNICTDINIQHLV